MDKEDKEKQIIELTTEKERLESILAVRDSKFVSRAVQVKIK